MPYFLCASVGATVGLFLVACIMARQKVVEQDKPSSLLRQLELSGNFKSHSEIQMRMAYKMYVRGGMSPSEIAKKVAVRADVITKWATLFQWDEARHQFEYAKFKKVARVAQKHKVDLGARHDRILHTIETLVEDMLERHQNASLNGAEEGLLSPKDLATLASCIKSTRADRIDARGEAPKSSGKNVQVSIDFGGNIDMMQRVGVAVADLTRQVGLLEHHRTQVKQLENVEDAEYEVLDDD